MRRDCIVIVSGGMDSVTLLHHLIKTEMRQSIALAFDYGQRHDKELACAVYQAKAVEAEYLLLDVTSLGEVFRGSALTEKPIALPKLSDLQSETSPSTYVPNRNMIFLSLAVGLAESRGINEVYYGAHRPNQYGYWDTTEAFVEHLNAIYSLKPDKPISIHAPFGDKTKTDIARIGLNLGVDYAQTWSCYAGSDKPCGTCPTCEERIKAFETVGEPDPLIG